MKRTVLLLSLVLVTCAVSAQGVAEKKVAWDFPVKPGTKEWAAFKTKKQKLEACQIPQEILSALSTKELVEICMNYPFYFEYTAYDDERKGISTVINSFNGLVELGKRTDGARELVLRYKALPVFDGIPLPSEIKGDNALLKSAYLELVLSTDEFINQLSQDELKEVQRIVRDRYRKEAENMETYSLFSIKKTFLLGAVAIDRQKDQSLSAEQRESVRKFIEHFAAPEPHLWTACSKIISDM